MPSCQPHRWLPDRRGTLESLKDRQRWNAIESGRNTNIKLGTLGGIAKALGVKPGDLLK